MLPRSAEQGQAVPLISSTLWQWPRDTEVLGLIQVSGWDGPQCCGVSRSFWMSQLGPDVML